ncbi:BofC C-terminal domain-containing protein [Paenibacillus alkaliterrae]|uniref:BofC C-terminal domain-containing protein n=1 Tax=Paenibacillus alkaliterrae TaxID=320909 RepID=UPI001F45C343|nr:BofC C-terminal domain-containing protein [Paenibacillus alkaliterrae]MCF2937283.1 BofC C-terminal domain-containing protein [Paenibacillus alkaliterrae]
MMAFSLWKNLKKRLRRKRRPMWMLGSIMLGLFAGSLYLVQSDKAFAGSSEPTGHDAMIQTLEQQSGTLSVNLHRIYVCGDEIKPLGHMMGKQIVQLLMQHPEWKAMHGKERNTIVFEQQIEDLSEHCKANAYMGVDKEGKLTLYDGVPKKEKVVRTFFQLDVNYMESSLPQDKLDQLAKGIRISDIDEYNSVLSTYSDYAIEPNEKVMKPAY